MRFLVDECTGPAVAQWLRLQNHDVVLKKLKKKEPALSHIEDRIEVVRRSAASMRARDHFVKITT